jgi:hypothetical protein
LKSKMLEELFEIPGKILIPGQIKEKIGVKVIGQ